MAKYRAGSSPGSPGGALNRSDRVTPVDGVMRPQRRWMTAQWGARREVYLQRLGAWMWMTRTRLGLSLADLAKMARDQGEFVSTSQLNRMELLREPGRAADRQHVSITAVAYLAALAGQTLADVDAYLRAGDTAAMDANLSSRAETVRTAFLTLSPARQRALEDFTQYLYELDLAEQGQSPSAAPDAPDARVPLAPIPHDGDTQRALAELHATVDSALADLSVEPHGAGGEDANDRQRKSR